MRGAADGGACSARAVLALLAACAAVVAVGYGGIVDAWFVADDFVLLAGLAEERGGPAALGIREGAPFLRPVLAGTFHADAALFGRDWRAMHVHGLVLHALAAWLVGLFAARFAEKRLAGVAAGLLFACCPLHPEAVTWISARGYPLAGCLTLVALLLAHRYARRPRATSLVGSGASGAAALFAVEPALPLPAYPVPLAWAQGRLRRGWAPAAVFAVAAVTYLALRWWWLGGLGGYRGAEGASVHAGFAPERVARYLVQTAGHLLAPGPWDGAQPWTWAITAVAAAAALVVTAAGLAARAPGWRRRTVALVICIAAALSVTAGWATLGADLGGTRYLYFASAFWFVLVGSLAAAASTRPPYRRGALAALAVLLAAQLVLVRVVNARFLAAGGIARAVVMGMVERVERDGARHLLVHGVPDFHAGAHVLPWAVETAARVFAGPDVRVDVVAERESWALVCERWNATPSEARRGLAAGSWDPATRAWVWLP